MVRLTYTLFFVPVSPPITVPPAALPLKAWESNCFLQPLERPETRRAANVTRRLWAFNCMKHIRQIQKRKKETTQMNFNLNILLQNIEIKTSVLNNFKRKKKKVTDDTFQVCF